MPAYYNEFDPFAAQWLRNLIAAGHIAPGDVDERSITDVEPDDLAGYTQCHFFAGIAVWSYALRRAGWPDDREVWTGSCPCQPFSIAGNRAGADDHRHLWPEFFRLIRERRPDVCFGEQVAGVDGRSWLDGVRSDLEREGYAVGAIASDAACFGAMHVRPRLYFVADAERERWQRPLNNDRLPRQQKSSHAVYCDAHDSFRRALDGDLSTLLCGDGASVQVERERLRAYGNGLFAPQAQAFATAYLEAREEIA